jgi:hypothetical protein
MRTEVKNDFIHIWTDDGPVLYSKVFRIPADQTKFAKFMEAYLECVRKHAAKFDVLYTLSDFSDINPPELPIIMQFYEEHIPAQLQLGIRFKAFVRPRNLFAQFALEDVKNAIPSAMGVFDTFEEGLQTIHRLDAQIRNEASAGHSNDTIVVKK